ncbi:hypothetical protein CYLTODRAFT_360114 [Cylindrobasidium torrendii FP15055 ss-10]|uniref:Uncharacterized protein n=1 Tax=Cylindrobasidium torrendii FP15055 ss-10 TaxID=1314674 RepID=A0A0D7AYR0_9AGAR|nr:hypothetical protein CYLTODRAFT_360114 [Cylindrobasidium torrendii FP15055 ss-10]
MSDAEPLYDHQHVRASSNASYASSDTSEDSPCYPSFDIYPNAFFNANGTVAADSDSFATYSGSVPVPAGLLQPPTGFVHHGTGCSQIPKLRVACAPGIHGERTMWSLCEQCGAIQMVESSS